MKESESSADRADTEAVEATEAEAGFQAHGVDHLLRGDVRRVAGSVADPRAARQLLALQRSAGNAAVLGLLRSVAPPAVPGRRVVGRAPGPVAGPPAGLLVADGGPEPSAGQIRQGEFLDRVHAEVAAVAAQEIDPKLFRTAGCPWIEHWIGYYRTKGPQEVEEAVRRYAPGSHGGAPEALVAAISTRVRDGLRAWRQTGEIPAPPADTPGAPQGQSFPGAGPGGTTLARTPAGDEPAALLTELGPGRPLDSGVRGRMAPALGDGLDGVRVHTDAPVASRLGAAAFAVGRHVAFAPGRYVPGTAIGDAMIAHELAHVVQQGDGPGPGQAGEPELESDADRAAAGAVAELHAGGLGGLARLARIGARTGPTLRSGLRLQRCQGGDADAVTHVYGNAPKTTDQQFAKGDVPGEAPVMTRTHGASFHFDGDGDQMKDMVATIHHVDGWPDGAVKTVRVELRQLSSLLIRTADFSLPATADGGAPLEPVVTAVTDGLHPTEVNLLKAPGDQSLRIGPAREGQGITEYSLAVVGASGLSTTTSVGFPFDTTGRRTVFSEAGPNKAFAAPAGPFSGVQTGNISSLDVSVGAYGDRFRLSVAKPEPKVDATVFGLSVLSEGVPVAGQRADLWVKGSLKLAMLRDDPARLSLDLNGDGKADLNLYDRLTEPPEGGPPVINRDHEITLEGPSLFGGEKSFRYPVRDGKIVAGEKKPAASTEQAASQARAVTGLTQQAGLKTVEDELAQMDAVLIRLRVLARDEKLITPELYTAWEDAARTMTILGPSIAAGAVSPTLKQQASDHLRAFGSLLDTQTAAEDRMEDSKPATGPDARDDEERRGDNPYSGAQVVRGLGMRISTATVNLAFALKEEKWGSVIAEYRKFVDGLDRWIAEKNQERYGTYGDKSRPETLRAAAGRQYAGQRKALSKIEGANRTRVSAVIHMSEAYEEEGQISEAPLSMYYWRDGDTWRLTDFTRTDETPTWSLKATSPQEVVPPRGLFEKLDENAHFPKGIIHYALPDGTGGQVPTTGPGTLRKVFTVLAIAAAVVGMAMLPIGRLAVPGAYVLAASALMGAGMAAVDIVDRWRHDNMRGEAILLDVLDIVTSFAGLGALKAGRILTGVREAAAAEKVMTMNPAIGWANRYYLPLRATEVGGNVVTLAVISGQLMEAMEAVKANGGTDKQQQKAFLHLFLQFAMTGGLTALAVRGVIPELSTGRSVAIHTINNVDYAVPVGQSVQGRAIDKSRGALAEGPVDTVTARQDAHLASIKGKVTGAPGEALADVELMAMRPTGEGSLQVDPAGKLVRNGTPWRSLQELSDQVTTANNVSAAHGMDVQYAIRIKPAGPDGQATVEVVASRRPGGVADPGAKVADATVRQYLASQTGRTQAVSDATQRLRALDPASTIEIRPDGRLRINHQLEIDAARVAEIKSGARAAGAPPDAASAAALGEKDLKTILNGTRELDAPAIGGSIDKLKADPRTKALAEELEKLGSSPAYRLRMPFHATKARSWAADLTLDAAHRTQMDALVRAADEPQLFRLFDIPNEGTPRGKANIKDTQAFFVTWALDQNPRDVNHFVTLYQFIRAEFIRRGVALERQARELMAAERITLEQARVKLGYGDARAGQPHNVDEFVWKQLHEPAEQTATTERWKAGVEARKAGTGPGVQVGLAGTEAESVSRIREKWPIPMHDPDTATYHVNKHHHELPVGDQFDPARPRPDINSDWDAYMDVARRVITAPDSRVTSAATQDGLGRVFTFKPKDPPSHSALVLVDYDGTATLLSFMPGKR